MVLKRISSNTGYSLPSSTYFKVLEGEIHEKIMVFLKNTKYLIILSQHFEENRSAEIFLYYLNNKISNGFNSGLLTEIILIDVVKDISWHFPTKNAYIWVPKWSDWLACATSVQLKIWCKYSWLQLPILDVDFHKDPLLDLIIFSVY